MAALFFVCFVDQLFPGIKKAIHELHEPHGKWQALVSDTHQGQATRRRGGRNQAAVALVDCALNNLVIDLASTDGH